jgi:predicted DNA-binding transcriptional regulator YafY
MSNILAVDSLDESFARPADFDLASYWIRSSREYELGNYRAHAAIRLSPRGRTLIGLLGSYVEAAVAKSAGEPDRQGWLRCTIPVESGDFGIRELLRLGEDLEVLGPAPLRIQVRQALRRMLRHYQVQRPR